MNRRLIATALCLLLLLTPTFGAATPLADKRAQAQRVKAQVDALDAKLEIAVEDYNGASDRYGALTAKANATNARLHRITKRVNRLQTSLNTRVDSMYRSGPLGVLDVLLDVTSFEDFASTWDLLNQMNRNESRSVAQLRTLRMDVRQTKRELDVTRKQARTVYLRMADRKRTITNQLAERQSKLKGVEREVAALVAAQRAAEAARYGFSGDSNWGDPGNLPRDGVVGIARKYLGCPYSWGASGPNSFDCSGFTMYVYRQVGVSLPHHAADQINCGSRVGRAYLKPGDLVFFGSPIHHVGLYVGNGLMIHAPGTGDHVRIAPILGDYVGACRP